MWQTWVHRHVKEAADTLSVCNYSNKFVGVYIVSLTSLFFRIQPCNSWFSEIPFDSMMKTQPVIRLVGGIYNFQLLVVSSFFFLFEHSGKNHSKFSCFFFKPATYEISHILVQCLSAKCFHWVFLFWGTTMRAFLFSPCNLQWWLSVKTLKSLPLQVCLSCSQSAAE